MGSARQIQMFSDTPGVRCFEYHQQKIEAEVDRIDKTLSDAYSEVHKLHYNSEWLQMPDEPKANKFKEVMGDYIATVRSHIHNMTVLADEMQEWKEGITSETPVEDDYNDDYQEEDSDNEDYDPDDYGDSPGVWGVPNF